MDIIKLKDEADKPTKQAYVNGRLPVQLKSNRSKCRLSGYFYFVLFVLPCIVHQNRRQNCLNEHEEVSPCHTTPSLQVKCLKRMDRGQPQYRLWLHPPPQVRVDTYIVSAVRK